MLCSVFTPVNKTRWLEETYSSLKLQHGVPWEWVLVPNQMSVEDIPPGIRRDPRVRVVPYPAEQPITIGALKRFACEAARGDVFVELDHDDLLVPGILGKVAERVDKGAGFVFSDVAVFEDGNCRTHGYSPDYGWEHYYTRAYGWPLMVTRNFPISARSLAEIHYAPDHVRCWSRQAYQQAGGHDASLLVGDDHDLMIRTYLSGAEFSPIRACGYLYRFHDTNSVKKFNRQIQEQQARNRALHLRDLVRVWGEREKLDWGDVREWQKAGWSVAEGMCPAAENSLGYIKAYNVLQFLTPDQLVDFFNMAYDALVPGGWLLVDAPSSNDMEVFKNPRHRSYHNPQTFAYYSRREYARTDPRIRCRFQVVQAYDQTSQRYTRGKDQLLTTADLYVLKGQRAPGPNLI